MGFMMMMCVTKQQDTFHTHGSKACWERTVVGPDIRTWLLNTTHVLCSASWCR